MLTVILLGIRFAAAEDIVVPLRTQAQLIVKLAEYVDSKMRAVSEQTHTVDTARLAVLAALNIADEYHLLKRKLDGKSTDYTQRAHQLADALDEVLGSDKRRAS